ncbi:MAG: hypothetical protein LBP59_18465 [Planctomycetaceae bacterium]|nr:hypothetical protein [Planctomycetaceae bacterium]
MVAFRQHAGETPAIRWSRLHFRIAGVSPACGCTQLPNERCYVATVFLFALRQFAAEIATFLLNFMLQKFVPHVSLVSLVPQKLPKRNLINKFSRRL